jgi:hypothetical protein
VDGTRCCTTLAGVEEKGNEFPNREERQRFSEWELVALVIWVPTWEVTD